MAAIAYTPAHIRPLEGAVLRDYDAGGNGEVGNVIYIASDDDVEVTDADAAATAHGRGIVVAVNKEGETSFVAGDRLSVCVFGPVGGFSGMTPGSRVYVDADAGKLDHTSPAVSMPMGYAESAGVVFVAPSMSGPTS